MPIYLKSKIIILKEVSSIMNRNKQIPFLLLIPALIAQILFFIYPFIKALYLSLTDYDGISIVYNFVGMKNYLRFFKDPEIPTVFLNTFKYALGTYVIQTVIAITLAVIVCSNIKKENFFRTIIYAPNVISTVAIGYIFSYLYNPLTGGVNPLVHALGFKNAFVDILGNPKTALLGVMSVNIWATTGFHFIVYLANMQSIPKDYYEAANMDGASAWQKFRNITFPFLAPAFTIMTVISTIFSLQEFNIPYIMTNTISSSASRLVANYFYTLFSASNSQYGYATAVSVILFVIIMILSIIQINVLGKREEKIR